MAIPVTKIQFDVPDTVLTHIYELCDVQGFLISRMGVAAMYAFINLTPDERLELFKDVDSYLFKAPQGFEAPKSSTVYSKYLVRRAKEDIRQESEKKLLDKVMRIKNKKRKGKRP